MYWCVPVSTYQKEYTLFYCRMEESGADVLVCASEYIPDRLYFVTLKTNIKPRNDIQMILGRHNMLYKKLIHLVVL